MPEDESKPEVPSDSGAKTEEPTTEPAAAAAETEQESSTADVVAAAEAAANETEDTSKTETDKFSTVDMIRNYILNNTASTSAPDPATTTTTGATSSTSSLINHLTDATMSSLLAQTGEESTISTAAAVASIGAEAAGNYPAPNEKIQHLQSLMDSKMPAAATQEETKAKEEGKEGDIAMIPLVYSVNRQGAASPTQLSMLSTALQPKGKFKVMSSSAKKRKEKSPSVKNYIDDSPVSF